MTEVQLLEQKDLREKAIEKIEVLDKVKKLFLIPDMEVMTTKMVADYYEVKLEAVQSCYKDNKQEIDEDGVIVKSYKDFLSVLKGQLTILNGKTIININDTVKMVIPRTGTKVFPQRAILRIGMLLRDSKIAKEVRTQLLNTFEHSTTEQRTAEIDEEQRLQINVGIAYSSGNMDEFTRASMEYNAYKNRYITKIKNENDKLTKVNTELETVNSLLLRKTMEWGNKAILNALIRKLALVSFHRNYQSAWSALYRQVKYKLGIDVYARKRMGNLIDQIDSDEIADVIAVAVSLCKNYNIDIAKTVNDINDENIKMYTKE